MRVVCSGNENKDRRKGEGKQKPEEPLHPGKTVVGKCRLSGGGYI
jgi:hypothetical protein